MQRFVQAIAKTIGIHDDIENSDDYGEDYSNVKNKVLSNSEEQYENYFNYFNEYSQENVEHSHRHEPNAIMSSIAIKKDITTEKWSSGSLKDFKNFIRNNGEEEFCLYLRNKRALGKGSPKF